MSSMAYASNTTTPTISTAANARRTNRVRSALIHAQRSIQDANGSPILRLERRLFDEAPHFLFVVLAVQNFPFRAAFGNAALLVFDLLTGSLVDLGFFQEPLVQDFDNGKPNGIPVFDEIDFVNRREFFCNLV